MTCVPCNWLTAGVANHVVIAIDHAIICLWIVRVAVAAVGISTIGAKIIGMGTVY